MEQIWIKSQAGRYTHLPGLKFESPKIKYIYKNVERNCYRCQGKATERGFIYDSHTHNHSYGDIPCMVCKGKGTMTDKVLQERRPNGTETKERSLCGSSVLRSRTPANISERGSCPNCKYVEEFINANI